LERKELEARDDHWKHHIDEHLKPYGCLFPECAESQLFFTHRNQWKTHMESAHSKDWLRKVHTIVWYCDIDHDVPETFETELQWREHMQNLDSHPKRKLKTPTQAQLDALSPRKQQAALRDKFVCPLCEQIPEKIRPLIEKGQGDPSQMYAFVVDHVANHLKSLSLMAVPSLDTTVPETPGAFGKSVSLRSDSFKRPMRENSVPQPHSGKEHLDGISLPSETWSNLDQDAMAFVTPSRQSSVWDKEYPDYKQPEDVPEPLEQEWLEGWKSWRSENDPFPSQDARSDPILVHLIKAKNAGSTHLSMQEPTLDQLDIDERDEIGRTALSIAAEIGDIEAVQRLLKKGAGLEVADEDGYTPLLWAASNGHEATVRLLLGAGARADAADQRYGRTPLSWAASKGHETVVRLLLERGAEVDAADNSRRTPLSWAASRGQEATVLLLIENGADIESCDPKYGHTPLSWAAVRGHEATVRLLLEHGAKVNTPDREHGRTPLSWAAENGHEAVVRRLFSYGGDIEATDRESLQTPLMFAAENGHEGTVRLLLELGALLDAKDLEGRTALSWATDGGHDDVTHVLRSLGTRDTSAE
jgi:ankyrin repeat protein